MSPRFDAIGIVAADLGRSLAFYRRLGLDIPAEADQQPHVDVALPGGMRLMFDTEETILSFDPGWTAPGDGRVALAFACDDPADVDRTYAELLAAGYEGHLEPWDAAWNHRYACLRDPDGNGVDLFAPLESDPS